MKLLVSTSLIFLVLTSLGITNPCQAATPTQPTTMRGIAKASGLSKERGCLQFVDKTSVEFRKERWLRAIEQMYKLQPEAVIQWMIGAAKPPDFVVQEAKRQKDCLIEAMFREAAHPDSPLIVDWWDRTSKKSEMAEVVESFEAHTSYSAHIVERITRSSYRNAQTQSWIWKRKFIFSGNNFNRISSRASERCELPAGRTWSPAMKSHRACWHDKLSGEEREREILGASAAPGISRHHWGTEFDLFSLNPKNFLDGARLADEYKWLSEKGHQFGYFQPYQQTSQEHGYMEERWHWSYYPIAQALVEFGLTHESVVKARLFEQWDKFEKRWNRNLRRSRPFFDYVRSRWRDYMFKANNSLPHE